ncbi:hypothetical protein [Streptomyces sp. NPDC053427]|uniref:hypothetical protein n=1 Tax=Streptomyces sp. NPDC053427 TaxID=3365701 RepID=UPI0037CFAC7F
MATTLTWTITEILKIRSDALKVEEKSLKGAAENQIGVLRAIKDIKPLSSSVGQRPTRQDLDALRRSGSPWNHLAHVAAFLVEVDSESPMEFARRHLLPDKKLRWRLFHLGVLGVLLKSLRSANWKLTSRRPLSASKEDGPQYTAISPDGHEWDIWFESGSMFKHYGIDSPYRDLMAEAFSGDADPVGADLAIVRRGAAAYLFECKYTDEKGVRRDGYHQITTYVTEALEQLVVTTEGFIVGPDDVVTNGGCQILDGSPIHIVGPAHLSTFLPKPEEEEPFVS